MQRREAGLGWAEWRVWRERKGPTLVMFWKQNQHDLLWVSEAKEREQRGCLCLALISQCHFLKGGLLGHHQCGGGQKTMLPAKRSSRPFTAWSLESTLSLRLHCYPLVLAAHLSPGLL